MSIRAFYDRWPQYNRRLTEIVGAMTDEQGNFVPPDISAGQAATLPTSAGCT